MNPNICVDNNLNSVCVAIVLLQYNNYEDTVKCIESVEQFNTANIRYIIVDNGSPRKEAITGIANYLSLKFGTGYQQCNDGDKLATLKQATLLISQNNSGYASGNNKGIQLAYADSNITHIMILNNDVLFVEDIIGNLVYRMEQLEDCAIISPVLFKKGMEDLDYNCARKYEKVWQMIYSNFFHYVFRTFNYKIQQERNLLRDKGLDKRIKSHIPLGVEVMKIDMPSGSCMLVDKGYFQSIGSFDEGTFMFYEENILHRKVQKTKKQNYLDLTTRCIHLGASSTKKQPNNWLLHLGLMSQRYYVRNYSECSWFTYCILVISQYWYELWHTIQQSLNIKMK